MFSYIDTYIKYSSFQTMSISMFSYRYINIHHSNNQFPWKLAPPRFTVSTLENGSEKIINFLKSKNQTFVSMLNENGTFS